MSVILLYYYCNIVSKYHHFNSDTVDTHKICGVFCPHVWYQAVICQCPFKDNLDPCRVAFL